MNATTIHAILENTTVISNFWNMLLQFVDTSIHANAAIWIHIWSTAEVGPAMGGIQHGRIGFFSIGLNAVVTTLIVD
jgi:hypothetical protein